MMEIKESERWQVYPPSIASISTTSSQPREAQCSWYKSPLPPQPPSNTIRLTPKQKFPEQIGLLHSNIHNVPHYHPSCPLGPLQRRRTLVPWLLTPPSGSQIPKASLFRSSMDPCEKRDSRSKSRRCHQHRRRQPAVPPLLAANRSRARQ